MTAQILPLSDYDRLLYIWRSASQEDRSGFVEYINKHSRSKVKTFMHDDWQPTEETLQWFFQQGYSFHPHDVLEQFRDYWLQEGVKKANWDATFRNRCRQLKEWGK